MCFSAEASFTGGAVLTAIGIASVKSAHNPLQKLFAGIPLFFALQQFAEGVVWLSLRSGDNYQLQMTAAYIFLVMALVIWPFIIPLAVLRLEEVKKRKKIITAMLVAGALISCYYSVCLISFNASPVII